jgi:HdeA/HdeB family
MLCRFTEVCQGRRDEESTQRDSQTRTGGKAELIPVTLVPISNARVHPQKRKQMHKFSMSTAVVVAVMIAGSGAKAQVNLSEYADPEGFLDVQALTCAQLAGTWQDQADLLSSWYSGWYNGLAKRHYMDIRKGREAEHELIVYCKANPQLRIIQAIDVVFKSMRERMGIKVQ